jgi:sugar/nucleoside kinase (ribokinase family)
MSQNRSSSTGFLLSETLILRQAQDERESKGSGRAITGLYFRRVPRTDLLTVGEAFQDLIFVGLPHMPRHGEELKTARFVSTIGGGAVITAAAAARLGVRTTVISGLSREAVRGLREDHVSIVNLRRETEPHAVSVSLSTARDRSFVTFNGVNDRLQRRLPAAITRQRATHVHFAFSPDDCGRWTRIVQRVRARGATTSWDFGWNPPLLRRRGFGSLVGSLDFVFLNEAESAMYARTRRSAAAIAYWRRSARNTIIKLGRRGSRWLTATRDLTAPAPRVPTVDTTGAGDAFNGGFLFAVLGGRPPSECLRIGNFVGARSTMAAGGLSGLPRRSELP